MTPEPVYHQALPEGAVRSYLEAAPPDPVGDLQSFRITGWVCSTAEPVQGIEVLADGLCWQTVEGLSARPDVAATFPDAVGAPWFGFSTAVWAFGLPPETELTLEAVLASGRRVRFGTFRVRCTGPAVAHRPALTPIPVVGLGRSGSTLMLRLLRAHPDVVVPGDHPYEVRPLTFWLNHVRTLFQSPPTGAGRSQFWAGINPLCQPWYEPRPEDRAEIAREELRHRLESLDRFFRQAAEFEGRAGATYFVEKMPPGPAVLLAERLYPAARAVVLVRDFRDTLCSSRAFNARRGIPSFGRQFVGSDAEQVDLLAPEVEWLRRYWEARRDRALLVRYEDLVARPHEVVRGLFRYLGLDASAGRVTDAVRQAEQEGADVSTHRTSPTAAGSVGRWVRDLPPDLRRRVEEKMAGSLEAFGYLTPAAGRG